MKFTYVIFLSLLFGCASPVTVPVGIEAQKWQMLDKAEEGDRESIRSICSDVFSRKPIFPEATIERLKKNKEIIEGCSTILEK
jgi:hypothetical protein